MVRPTGLLESKNQQLKVESFSTLFLIATITWITEKELERVIINKRDAGIWLEEKHENLVAAVRK